MFGLGIRSKRLARVTQRIWVSLLLLSICDPIALSTSDTILSMLGRVLTFLSHVGLDVTVILEMLLKVRISLLEWLCLNQVQLVNFHLLVE